MKNIFFLIGMPGAGKTFWGEKLSNALGYAFTDLDQYIEQKEGKTIAEIFGVYGEDHFRELEQESLGELVSVTGESPLIVASGGGTPCYLNNMALMLNVGTVIYLRATLDKLMANLCNDESMRPLLDGDALHWKLHHLLKQRALFYEQAHHIVDAENLSVATFGEIFRSCIKEH